MNKLRGYETIEVSAANHYQIRTVWFVAPGIHAAMVRARELVGKNPHVRWSKNYKGPLTAERFVCYSKWRSDGSRELFS